MRNIQTCGSFDETEGIYNISICFGGNHVMSLEGLSKEDMQELQSCIDCMLFEEVIKPEITD